MISVDVLNCFNTVLSDHLLTLLDRILTKVNSTLGLILIYANYHYYRTITTLEDIM